MARRKKVFKKAGKKKTKKKRKKTTSTADVRVMDEETQPEPEESEEPEEVEEPEVVEEEEPEPEERDPFDLGGSPERGRKRIYEMTASMGRIWGAHTMMPMSMAPVVRIPRMPIGILEFDAITGGIVLGRNNRFKGPKDSLKTTICLRTLAAAQRTCRHCKWRLVPEPETGRVNCRCPQKRYWLQDDEDLIWLPQEAIISLHHGHLPPDSEMTKIKGTSYMALKCEPPPHLKGTKGYTKKRWIPFGQTYRCEPMRCGYIDTEFTADINWVLKNRVDPELLAFSNAKWAEMGFEEAERMALTREVDFVVIDSTSMMETEEMLTRRKAGERGTPGGKQRIVGDFIKRMVASSMEEGVTSRYPTTLVTTSHLTTKGIGGKGRSYLGATDGRTADHGFAMDIKLQAERFVLDAEKRQSVYGVFNFTVDKNHCGGMGSTKARGRISYWLVETAKHRIGDVNDMQVVMDQSRKYGQPFITEGKKSTVKLVLHSPMIASGRKAFRSVTACRSYLEEHEGIYMDLRHRLLEHMQDERHMLLTSGGTSETEAN